jgi:phage protein D
MAAPNMNARYVPDFRVQINDADIPAALRGSITGVRYEDGMGAADRVEVSIANADLRWLQKHIKGLGFNPFPTGVRIGPVGASLTPEGIFDVDNKLTLALGYAPGPLAPMFMGDVTGVEAAFTSGAIPTMTLVAHDRMHRLTEGTYSRGFGPLPDAVIAMIISAENFLLPMIDPTVMAGSTALAVANVIFKLSGRKQKGQSDLEVMQEIAAQWDCDFWVEGDIFYLSRFIPKEYTPRLKLVWGESLIDFAPKISTVGRITASAMKVTMHEIPLSFLVGIFFDFDREAIGLQVVPGEAAAALKMVLGPMDTIIDQPIGSPVDIANSAMAIVRNLRTKLNNRLTASATAVGDTRIRAGAMITIDGIGPDFSGDYRVASATHTVDAGGYRTSFHVRKELLP